MGQTGSRGRVGVLTEEQQQADELGRTRTRVSELQERLRATEQEMRTMRERSDAELNDLQGILQRKEDDNATLEHQLREEQQRITELTTKLSTNKLEITELTTKLSTNKLEIKTIRELLMNLLRSLKERDADSTTLQGQQVTEQQQRTKKPKTGLMNHQSVTNRGCQSQERDTLDKDQLRTEIQRLTEEITTTQDLMDNLRGILVEKSKDNRNLNEELGPEEQGEQQVVELQRRLRTNEPEESTIEQQQLTDLELPDEKLGEGHQPISEERKQLETKQQETATIGEQLNKKENGKETHVQKQLIKVQKEVLKSQQRP